MTNTDTSRMAREAGMQLIHISWGGPDRYISVSGKQFKFEDHPYCGPIVLNKAGDPLENQPGQASPFWRAYDWWARGGKKTKVVAEKVWCEYETDLMKERKIRAALRAGGGG